MRRSRTLGCKPSHESPGRATERLLDSPVSAALPGLASFLISPQGSASRLSLHPGLRAAVPPGLGSVPEATSAVSRQKLISPSVDWSAAPKGLPGQDPLSSDAAISGLLLPATAQCPVKLNHRQQFVPSGLGYSQFGVEQVAVSIQGVEKSIYSATVPHIGQARSIL